MRQQAGKTTAFFERFFLNYPHKNLVKIFADLSLGAHGALDDDLLGDGLRIFNAPFRQRIR